MAVKMLHSKVFQKYLASVVCCLVLVMGISTLLLAYSFHIHRSPLLVKALGSGESLESPNRGHLLQSSEQKNISPKGIFTDGRFTTFSNKPENELQTSTEISSFGVSKTFNQIPKIKNDKLEVITKTDKPVENNALTDTIYIDDFERGKTIHHLSEETDLRENNEKIIENPMEKIEIADLTISKKKFKAINKSRKNKKHKNKKNRKDANFQTDETVTENEIEANLDAVYDVQKNNYKAGVSNKEKFNDDTEDDLSAHGSGSGDFPITDDTEVEELPYYDNFVVQHFSADWIDDDNHLVKTAFSGKRKLNVDGRQAQKRYKSKERRTGQLKSGNMMQLNNKQLFEMSLPEKISDKNNEAFDALGNESIKSVRKKQKKTRKLYAGPFHEGTQKPSPTEKQGQLKAPDDLVNSSETWLETRTRRIMGNVKKSEERSRQLLLCEEAGGGELCRMLFKGHISE